MKFYYPLTILVFFFYSNSSISQKIIYVDPSATGLENGTSWMNAYKNLDSALSKAISLTASDTIKVAQGIYKPSKMPPNVTSSNPRDASFLMPAKGNLLGGYPSGGGERDPKRFATIISGDIGIPNDSTDNVYHVITFIRSEATFDGFTIEKGNASGNGSLLIDTVNLNRAEGGGLYFFESYVRLNNIILKENLAGSGGGCSVNSLSDLHFNNCFFLNNSAFEDGGAIKIASGSSAFFINGVFNQNRAQRNGGAIINFGDSSYLSLDHCTLVQNSSYNKGGAIYNLGQYASVNNSLFTLNYIWLPEFLWDPGVDIDDSAVHSEVTYSLLQAFDGREGCIKGEIANLSNTNDPSGPDKIWGTADDGLRITPASLGFRAGNSLASEFDIIGNRRLDGGFDIGAYETNACSFVRNRTVYVDSAAKGNNTGESWNNGFSELQSALNLAYFGCADTIKVAKGTYIPLNPPRTVDGPYARYHSFTIAEGVSLIGGYPSGGGSRNPSAYITRLSGTEYDFSPSCHVLMVTGKNNVLIDGFSIENGNAYGSAETTTIDGIKYPNSEGGGVLIYNSNVQIRNCSIKNNKADLLGGGIRAHNSKISFYNCMIQENQTVVSSAFGGGIYLSKTLAGSYIGKTNFENNTGSYGGGAIGLSNILDTLTIDSCTFRKNRNQTRDTIFNNISIGGGAIHSNDNSKILIDHSLFEGNIAWLGGALHLSGYSKSTIKRSVFINNTASKDGGAELNTSGSNVTYSNSIFIGNKAKGKGGVAFNESNSEYYFCNFLQNSANENGGAFYNLEGILIHNSIFWKNSVNGSITNYGVDVYNNNSSWDPRITLLQAETGPLPGSTNMRGIDPMFVDSTNFIGADGLWGTRDDGLNLRLESPLLNKFAYYTLPSWLETDIAGRPRVSCKMPDIGAYEADDCSFFGFTNHTIYVDSSAVNGKNNGVDWQNAFTSLDKAIAVVDSFSVDTIKMARGTYKPATAKGFVMPSNVALLGGYESGGGKRDFNKNTTILGYNSSGTIVSIEKKGKVLLDGLIIENVQYVNYGSCINAQNTELSIQNTRIRNSKNGAWSAVYLYGCTGRFVNCSFYNNEGGIYSGALYNEASPIQYINCIFYNNSSRSGGAAAFINSPNLPSFINCTFYKNYDTYYGIGAIRSITTPYIRNCIFWGNKRLPAAISGFYNEVESAVNFVPSNISSSLFEYPTQEPITGCIIGKYPGFKDTLTILGPDAILGTEDDGLILNDSSIAINRGANSFIPPGILTDLTGKERVIQDTIDLGAYEFGFAALPPACPIIPPDFSYTIDSVEGSTITFNDLTPANYLDYHNAIKWYFGDGDSSTALAPVHKYANPGSYTAKMIYTSSSGCSKDTTKTIVINTTACNLKVSFTYSGNTIAPATINFVNTTLPDSSIFYKWYFGTEDSSSLKNPSHVFVTPGTYTIKLMASTKAACIRSHDTTIVIDPSPACQTKAGFSISGATTAPATIGFQNSSTNANTFQWNFGDGSSSSLTSPVHTFANPGVYSVRLVANATSGCADTLVKNITIKKQDSCIIKPGFIYFSDSAMTNTVYFINTTASMDSSTKKSWDFGDGSFAVTTSPIHNFNKPGTYKVCLTITKDSLCQGTFCDTVSINNPPIESITVYPNPAGATLTVSFDLPIADEIDLLIYNDGGSIVKKVHKNGFSGTNTVQIDISDLQKGLFILKVDSARNLGYSIKFIKL